LLRAGARVAIASTPTLPIDGRLVPELVQNVDWTPDWGASGVGCSERHSFGEVKRQQIADVSVRCPLWQWLVWHGKGSKAVERIKALDGRLLTREGYEFSTLWWNLNTVSGYLRNNAHTLVNCGARHRKGLPISSSIAESAVNQVVSHRMAKK